MKCLLALAVILPALQASASGELIERWLTKQATLETWSADFTQTRTLKSFAQPLTAEGKVWFAAPNRFRWELGQQTIAVRQPEQMLVLYPRLKRVEKYPLTGNQMGPWRDALSLLEAGFPRSRKELDDQFKIHEVIEKDGNAELVLEPKAAGARRMMPQIRIVFSIEDLQLRATQLHFADGSIMRNDFRNPKVNETIDSSLFNPPIPGDFKVVEPLKKP